MDSNGSKTFSPSIFNAWIVNEQQMVNTQEAAGKEDDPSDYKAFLTVRASKTEELIV